MMAGQLLASRYELGERLGIGGMSTVQLALDRRLERHVAVKLLAEHLAEDQQFVSRFRREALAAARLVHPNIVQVFDFGFDESAGRHFIVMEHVRGHSVRGAPARARPPRRRRGARHRRAGLPRPGLRPPQRRRAPRREARQPAARRRRGRQARRLRHREGGRAVGDHPGRLGAGHRRLPGARAGPGRRGRPAADIYSLGVVTYQLLRRRAALRGRVAVGAGAQQQREAPASLDELNPDVPQALAGGRRCDRPGERARPMGGRGARDGAPRGRPDSRPARPRVVPGDTRGSRDAGGDRHRRRRPAGRAPPGGRAGATPAGGRRAPAPAPTAAERPPRRRRPPPAGSAAFFTTWSSCAARRRRRDRLIAAATSTPTAVQHRGHSATGPAHRCTQDQGPGRARQLTAAPAQRARHPLQARAPARRASPTWPRALPAWMASRRSGMSRAMKVRLCSVSSRIPVSSWARTR